MLALRNTLVRNVSTRILRPVTPIVIAKRSLNYSKPNNQEGEEYAATGTIKRIPISTFKTRKVKKFDDSVAKVSVRKTTLR